MSTVVTDEKATAKTAPREYQQFIGGKWVPASNGATYDDHDPFSGDTVATIPASNREDARKAVEAAASAFPAWWETPPGEKQRLFLKAADILERRQMEVVGLLANETGCTFGFGMFQTIFTTNLRDPARRSARRVLHGDPPAGRRRRRTRALECPADPFAPGDRRRDCPGQHRRPEAIRRVAHHRRDCLCRDLRGGRLPGRSLQCRDPRARPGRTRGR